jgi:hypothetical protein
MIFLAALPFGLVIAAGLAVAVSSLLMAFVILRSPVILLGSELSAKSLRLPLEILGEVTIFEDPNEVRDQLGPSLNANAKLAIRGDLKQLLKVEITDESDPTPYVLISTRAASELASALRANLASL